MLRLAIAVPALTCAVLALPACDKPAAPAPADTASAVPAATTPAATVAAAPPPPDLDVAAQQKALKCATDAKSGACGVLAKMATCTAWNPIVPSGDGRWAGRGWLVEGAKTTDQVTLVRARRVPTSEVAPGQLGVRIAVADIPKQEGAAHEQADRAIRAYERADVPPHGSPTLDYVKQKTDWSESFAAKTSGTQVVAQTAHGTYFCQGPNRALLLVQRAAATGSDGLYGELWPISW
jgi:hypothetical protein